jgi:hypothetical protein
MELSHAFCGVSGKQYEYLWTPLDEVDRTSIGAGTYVLAASSSTGPIFLYCREARCLREALVSEKLTEQQKVSAKLALYTRTDPGRDKIGKRRRGERHNALLSMRDCRRLVDREIWRKAGRTGSGLLPSCPARLVSVEEQSEP